MSGKKEDNNFENTIIVVEITKKITAGIDFA